MIFSPSLWASPDVYSEPMYFAAFDSPTKIYLYGGSKEGSGMLPNLKKFKESVEKAGRHRAQIRLETDLQGHHNEARWGKEFPKAAEWLFG
jgi:predicted alpha/beta superfamily hydrolase